MKIRRVVEDSGLTQSVLARDAGVSYHAIRSWVLGHRVPGRDSVTKLAGGLRSRGEKLLELADRLDEAAEDMADSI